MSDQVKILSCLCGGQPKRVAVNLDERFAYAQEITYQCRECHHHVTVRGDTSKPGYADNTGIEDRAIAAWNAYASIQTEKVADMQRRLDEFSALFGPMIDYIRAEVFVPLGASLTHTLLEDHKRLKEEAHKDGLLRVRYAQRIEELEAEIAAPAADLLLDAVHALTKYCRPGSTEAALILRIQERLDKHDVTACDGHCLAIDHQPGCPRSAPVQSPKLEELRQRVVDATRHERHRTKDESRYWCDQYKQIAHGFVSVLEGK